MDVKVLGYLKRKGEKKWMRFALLKNEKNQSCIITDDGIILDAENLNETAKRYVKKFAPFYDLFEEAREYFRYINPKIVSYSDLLDTIFELYKKRGLKCKFIDKMGPKLEGAWVVHTDYQTLKEEIIKNIQKGDSLLKKTYLVGYAIQLRNGSRISEAVEALHKFLNDDYEEKNGKKICKVRVRKKKKEEYREIIFPEWIEWRLIERIKRNKDRYQVLKNLIEGNNMDYVVRNFRINCKEILGVNTHTLRHMFITYLGCELGRPAQEIAKITKHSRLEYITRYTELYSAMKIMYDGDKWGL